MCLCMAVSERWSACETGGVGVRSPLPVSVCVNVRNIPEKERQCACHLVELQRGAVTSQPVQR